jgi:hypothetical protein
MYRNFKIRCILSILLLVVFGEVAAEENFQLIGFRGNRLVEIELPSKERTLRVFDYTLAIEGATTIDQERIVLSYNNELHIYNRRTNKETKLGSGRYPTYNQNTKSLYFFASSFTDGAWKHYLRKSELANDELTNTEDLSVIPKNQSGGHIFLRADNKIIFQSGGNEVFEWDAIAAKLTALPIQDCNLILLRSKTNGLVCKSSVGVKILVA